MGVADWAGVPALAGVAGLDGEPLLEGGLSWNPSEARGVATLSSRVGVDGALGVPTRTVEPASSGVAGLAGDFATGRLGDDAFGVVILAGDVCVWAAPTLASSLLGALPAAALAGEAFDAGGLVGDPAEASLLGALPAAALAGKALEAAGLVGEALELDTAAASLLGALPAAAFAGEALDAEGLVGEALETLSACACAAALDGETGLLEEPVLGDRCSADFGGEPGLDPFLCGDFWGASNLGALAGRECFSFCLFKILSKSSISGSPEGGRCGLSFGFFGFFLGTSGIDKMSAMPLGQAFHDGLLLSEEPCESCCLSMSPMSPWDRPSILRGFASSNTRGDAAELSSFGATSCDTGLKMPLSACSLPASSSSAPRPGRKFGLSGLRSGAVADGAMEPGCPADLEGLQPPSRFKRVFGSVCRICTTSIWYGAGELR